MRLLLNTSAVVLPNVTVCSEQLKEVKFTGATVIVKIIKKNTVLALAPLALRHGGSAGDAVRVGVIAAGHLVVIDGQQRV